MATLKPVTAKLATLRKKAKGAGCLLMTNTPEFSFHVVIAIVPDNPVSKQRFENGLTDGAIQVFVQKEDLDKRAANSRYFKKLVELEGLFEKNKERLAQYALKLHHEQSIKHINN